MKTSIDSSDVNEKKKLKCYDRDLQEMLTMGQEREDYILGMFWILEDLEPLINQKSKFKAL